MTGVLADLRRLLGLSRHEWWRLGGAVLLGGCASGAAIGLMATSGWLISEASLQPPVLTLTVAIVMVRFFGLSRGVFRYLERLVGHDAAFRVLRNVRVSVYQRLERLAPTGLPAFRSGDLLARLVHDVDTLQEFYLRVVPPYAVAAVVGSAVVVFLGWLVPAAGVATLVGLAVAALVVPAVAAAVARRAERRVSPLRGEMSASVVELVQGLPELVAYDAADRMLARLDGVDADLRRVEQRAAVAAGLGSGLTTLVTGLTVVANLLLGAEAVRAGRLDGPWLAVLVLTPLAAFELAAPLPMAAQQLSRVREASRRLVAVTEADPPVAEPVVPAPLPPAPYRVVVDDVRAVWSPDAPAALDGVSVDLVPGHRVAVVGESGSGKSTLAAVLLRFLDPAHGVVTLSGVDLRDLAEQDLRGVVGLLDQDAHLFDNTVEANLRVGRRDATADELRDALGRARLLDWVDDLPQGLQTRVGEHGATLSGGQRQRLALARVLLARFPVLVLDEPAEHLDLPTADALTADLLAATAGQTTLLVTHRLAGLADVDQVLVLAAGRVVEQGGHDELLAAGGRYAALWAHERELDTLLGAAT